MKEWNPMDGDTLITKDRFVFYAFGYEHPDNRVFSFVKNIPTNQKSNFPVRFLNRRWKLKTTELIRPEKLYTAQNYQKLLSVFQNKFGHYVYFCPYRRKEVISVPLNSIRKVYVPNMCLKRLLRKKRKDKLQKLATELIYLLSTESNISIEDFGIRGSIALDIHDSRSDIDLVVYGGMNFRILEKTIEKLVVEGKLKYVFTKKLDKSKKYKGRYKDQIFAFNAVKKNYEINIKYGDCKYIPIKHVTFSCKIVDDDEAMFRPAKYQIQDYQSSDLASKLLSNETPTKVVSMIGYYRNIAKRGERLKVSGELECVENIKTGEINYQVVVGTGTGKEERICPI